MTTTNTTSNISSVINATRNIYYPLAIPHEISDENRIAFESGPAYPVALEFSLLFGLSVVSVWASNNHSRVIMARPDGFNAVQIHSKHKSEKHDNQPLFQLHAYTLPYSINPEVIATSTKSKYLVNKYRSWLKPDGEYNVITRVIWPAFKMLDERVTYNHAEIRNNFEWGDELRHEHAVVQAMVEAAVGVNPAIPDMYMTKIDALYKKYQKHADTKTNTKKELVELFSGPKYLIATPSLCSIDAVDLNHSCRSGLIFAVTHVTQIQAPAKVELIESPRWYPSLDHIPEKYRDDVKAKLTFARIYRDAGGPSMGQKRDAEGLIPPAGECVWTRAMNMATWRSGYGTQYFQFLMFDKSAGE